MQTIHTHDGAVAVGTLSLLKRLQHVRPAPVDGGALDGAPLRIGIQDDDGHLLHTIETTSLVEAVAIFEVLGDFRLESRPGTKLDGRSYVRLFRRQLP